MTEVETAYVGHATVLIELDGVRILTDPVLGPRLGPLRRHGPTPSLDRLGQIDAVLVSHAHPDHFQQGSIGAVRGSPQVVVPVGLGARAGVSGGAVHELRVNDAVQVGPVRIVAVPARHWRLPGQPRALGYLIQGSLGVYFAGDTSAYPRMADLAGRVDLAFLPVGRWGPHPGPDRLGPASAATVAALVGARAAVPIHWGTFYPPLADRLWPRSLREPAELFAAEMRATAAACQVRIVEPGGVARIALDPVGGPVGRN